jgi:hypothetical protein
MKPNTKTNTNANTKIISQYENSTAICSRLKRVSTSIVSTQYCLNIEWNIACASVYKQNVDEFPEMNRYVDQSHAEPQSCVNVLNILNNI